MEKIFKLTRPIGVGSVEYARKAVADLYVSLGWQPQEGFFLPKEEKPKYRYDVVDFNGTILNVFSSRERARDFKRAVENYPLEGDAPPYKIVRYQLVNPTHIR